MNPYEYKIKNQSPEQRSVCRAWNTAYNLQHGCTAYSIPEVTGSGLLVSSRVNRDIRMIHYDLNFWEPLEMDAISRKPHLDILFCMGDDINWQLPESGKGFALFTGESYIGISADTEKKCVFPEKHNINILEIKIPLSSVSDLLEETCADSRLSGLASEGNFGQKYPLSPSAQVIVRQLLHCPYPLGQLYREAKLLELIAVYFSEILLQEDKPAFLPELSAEDIKCVRYAKEVLDKNLANPPTIKLLSKDIGLNEYKLKKGFKELFGISVHAYVIEKKLELAKNLLDESKISVSEAAFRAGYGNSSHFAAAFRKHYGTNPGEYLRGIKN